MMGRLEQDQGQLFYSFCLEEVVLTITRYARLHLCSICRGSMASFRLIILYLAAPQSIQFQ